MHLRRLTFAARSKRLEGKKRVPAALFDTASMRFTLRRLKLNRREVESVPAALNDVVRDVHFCACTHIHTGMHTGTYTHTHTGRLPVAAYTDTHTNAHKDTHTHTRAHTNTQTHTLKHTRTLKRTHTHMHTRTHRPLACSPRLVCPPHC